MSEYLGYRAPLRFSLFAATALAAPLFWAAAARAQAVAQSPTNATVQEVIVTANKREQRAQDVPASLVVLSTSDLSRRGIATLNDIVANTPGLNNPGGGAGPNSANVVIRGVTDSTNNGLLQSSVAQLYDDVTLDPIANSGMTNLRMVDVQRVEVLRGPQGTLYGSGSLAGAIRYVTNKPDLKAFSGNAEVTGASTSTGADSYGGSAMLNMPLVDDKLGLRVVAYGYRDGGWVDNLMTNAKDINGTDTAGVRATLRYQPSDKLTADLAAMYQHSTDRGAARSLYNPPAGSSGQVIDGIANEPIDSKNAIVSLNVQYDFDNFSIVSETAYHKRDNSLNGINYYYVPVISFAVAGANGYIQGPTYDGNPTNSDIYTEELRFSSKGSGPFKWTFGTFLLRSKSFLAGYEYAPALIPFIGGDTVVNRNDHHTQDETAGFAEATYTVAGKLDLTAGVRASHSTLDDKIFSAGYVPVKSANPAVFVKTAFTENDNPVTEHFSATYRWTPDFNLYVAAARGFRVGGINQASGRPGNISPPTYAADSLWNYEAGAKGNLFNGKFIYSADIYYIDWHNMQINVQNALGNYTSNAGDGGLYGFEGQFDAKLTEALRVGGGLTISHNRISTETSGISTPTGLRTLHKGDLLPASPERQASVYVERSFQIGEHSAYIRGSANYVGKEWVGFAKTGPSFGNYTVADLRAGVFIRSVEASLYVSNLFDRDGLLSASLASKSGPVIVANLDAIRLRPRTVGLTLRTSF